MINLQLSILRHWQDCWISFLWVIHDQSLVIDVQQRCGTITALDLDLRLEWEKDPSLHRRLEGIIRSNSKISFLDIIYISFTNLLWINIFMFIRLKKTGSISKNACHQINTGFDGFWGEKSKFRPSKWRHYDVIKLLKNYSKMWKRV